VFASLRRFGENLKAMKILRWSLQILLAVYWLFAVVMTHVPKPPPMGPEVSDKLIHFLAYGLLGGLLFLTMWAVRPGMRYMPVIVLGILVVYGAVDELTQPLFGRAAAFDDWVADCAGAAVAVVVLGVVRQAVNRRTPAAA
jgi:VanZ family protein